MASPAVNPTDMNDQANLNQANHMDSPVTNREDPKETTPPVSWLKQCEIYAQDKVPRLYMFCKSIFNILLSIPYCIGGIVYGGLAIAKGIGNVYTYASGSPPYNFWETANQSYLYSDKAIRALFCGIVAFGKTFIDPKDSAQFFDRNGPDAAQTHRFTVKEVPNVRVVEQVVIEHVAPQSAVRKSVRAQCADVDKMREETEQQIRKDAQVTPHEQGGSPVLGEFVKIGADAVYTKVDGRVELRKRISMTEGIKADNEQKRDELKKQLDEVDAKLKKLNLNLADLNEQAEKYDVDKPPVKTPKVKKAKDVKSSPDILGSISKLWEQLKSPFQRCCRRTENPASS